MFGVLGIAWLVPANAQPLVIKGSAPCSAAVTESQTTAYPSTTQGAPTNAFNSCGSPTVNPAGPSSPASVPGNTGGGFPVGETVFAVAYLIDKMAFLVDKVAFLMGKVTALIGKVAQLLKTAMAFLRSLRALFRGGSPKRPNKKRKPNASQGRRSTSQHSAIGSVQIPSI
jgi:hypothetical protein